MFNVGDKVRVKLHRDMRFAYMSKMEPLNNTICTISSDSNIIGECYRLDEDRSGFSYGDDVLTLLLPNNKGGKLL